MAYTIPPPSVVPSEQLVAGHDYTLVLKLPDGDFLSLLEGVSDVAHRIGASGAKLEAASIVLTAIDVTVSWTADG
jgi:hypothetical protein